MKDTEARSSEELLASNQAVTDELPLEDDMAIPAFRRDVSFTVRGERICFSMFIVQTVRLAPELRRDCFTAKLDLSEHQGADSHQYPAWLAAYNELQHTYLDTLCFRLDASLCKTNEMVKELDAVSALPLAMQLKPIGFDAHLFYDPHLRQWLIIYELGLAAQRDELFDVLKMSAEASAVDPAVPVRLSNDLFNSLRDAFVVSDGKARTAPFVKALEREAVGKVKQLMKELYDIRIKEDSDIQIVDSSGNITFFFPSLDNADEGSFAPLVKGAHERAERLGSTAEPLNVPGTSLYVFWGRFHTIVADDGDAIDRFMPIHFHAQFMWSYISKTTMTMQGLQNEVLGKRITEQPECIDFVNALNNSIQYAILMNEEFKRTIEGYNATIYLPVSNRWHIDESLQWDKEFSAFLSDYIGREMQKQSLRSESFQNKVLSAIGILGVLALIETWSNYLSLLEEGVLGPADGTILNVLFGNSEALLSFNTWFPIMVFLICVISIIVVFAKR